MDSIIIKEAKLIEENSEAFLKLAQKQINSDDHRIHQLLQDELIFSEETIRKICLKYRLRFLDVSLFKGEIPPIAFEKIQALENKYKTSLKPLRIIAPGRFFELDFEDKDPLLFVELPDKKFLFIHQWGREINPLRKIFSWPLQSLRNVLIGLGMLSGLLTLCLITLTGSWTTPLPILFFGMGILWVGLSFFSIFIALSFNIFPTEMNWNSQYLDK